MGIDGIYQRGDGPLVLLVFMSGGCIIRFSPVKDSVNEVFESIYGGCIMNFIELFLLAVGLSMDAFAVAVCAGLTMQKAACKKRLHIFDLRRLCAIPSQCLPHGQ